MNIDLLLAYICYYSYLDQFKENKDDVHSVYKNGIVLLDSSYIKHHYFDFENLEGYLIEFKDKNILVFRGSDEFKDWQENIKFDTLNTMIGTVHKGYYECFSKVWNNFILKSDILTILKSKKLYVTGHSFGGALATIAAYVLRATNAVGKNNMTVYTYGSPKVFKRAKISLYRMFNETLTAELNDNIFRYVNTGDIVPKLPFFDYYHVGKKVEVHKRGLIEKIFKSPYIFFSFLKSFYIFYFALDKINIIVNHKITTYVKILKWNLIKNNIQ